MKKVIIIGAGPAGLTAARELLDNTDCHPIIIEATNEIGGISKTHQHNGYSMDMGGHRFFSKDDKILDFWFKYFPLQGKPSLDDLILGKERDISSDPNAPDPASTDEVMLLRDRVSRIYYLRKFFDYPISLSLTTFTNLGFCRMVVIGCSYLKSVVFKITPEKSLEDFMINRFGKELYKTFFKDYTEKVWGYAPKDIPPEWGAQRIKGISIAKVLIEAVSSCFKGKKSITDKSVATSLIEEFYYPKKGPGQFWEYLSEVCVRDGAELHKNTEVIKINIENNKIKSVIVRSQNGEEEISGDYVISTMPIRDLIAAVGDSAPEPVRKVADGLSYRDFMTVGLLVDKLSIKNRTKKKTINDLVPDSWIYIQERDVSIGRLQIFNNWSPYMVQDIQKDVWIGLEYFVQENDTYWSMDDKKFIELATKELEKIDIIEPNAVRDACVVRVKKAYPGYFGTYNQFGVIREWLNSVENVYPVGRNGMHRYNNMDHSMLSAMEAVSIIHNKTNNKASLWNINTDEEYHETKSK